MSDLKNSNRKFVVDGVGEFFVHVPSSDSIRGSDWHYSRTYSSALTEGVPTHAEMFDILKKRGLVGEAYDKRSQELKEIVGNKIVEMELCENKEEKRVLAEEVSKYRQELFMWNQRVNGPLSNTCEQMAEDSRIEHLTSSIVRDKDGNKVWKDFDSYKMEMNRDLSFRARFEVMLFLQGLDSDFLEKTPENMVLKELDDDSIPEENKVVILPLEEKKPVKKVAAKKAAPKKTKKKEK